VIVDPECFSFVVDLDSETVMFTGGFSLPIYEMLDYRGDAVDDPKLVQFIVLVTPPEGLHVILDLDDIGTEEIISENLH
jgi:hypothetical protein